MHPATAAEAKPTGTRCHANARPASLVGRARSLRVQAGRLDPVLAVAYRRRAAELSFEAWLQAIREAPVEVDRFSAVAA
ncbi:MAG TPA: hypothetical protein VFH30_08745 [Acidimicrobiales bacterium]|nr:hypothetical protein [Acidimicrobiales bacterium]